MGDKKCHIRSMLHGTYIMLDSTFVPCCVSWNWTRAITVFDKTRITFLNNLVDKYLRFAARTVTMIILCDLNSQIICAFKTRYETVAGSRLHLIKPNEKGRKKKFKWIQIRLNSLYRSHVLTCWLKRWMLLSFK